MARGSICKRGDRNRTNERTDFEIEGLFDTRPAREYWSRNPIFGASGFIGAKPGRSPKEYAEAAAALY